MKPPRVHHAARRHGGCLEARIDFGIDRRGVVGFIPSRPPNATSSRSMKIRKGAGPQLATSVEHEGVVCEVLGSES